MSRLLRGRIRERDVLLFDCPCRTNAGRRRSTHRQSIVALCAPGEDLPRVPRKHGPALLQEAIQFMAHGAGAPERNAAA